MPIATEQLRMISGIHAKLGFAERAQIAADRRDGLDYRLLKAAAGVKLVQNEIDKQKAVAEKARRIYEGTESLFAGHFGVDHINDLPDGTQIPDVPITTDDGPAAIRVLKQNGVFVVSEVMGQNKRQMFISSPDCASNAYRTLIADPNELSGLEEVMEIVRTATTTRV
jgi:hypothetical protein